MLEPVGSRPASRRRCSAPGGLNPGTCLPPDPGTACFLTSQSDNSMDARHISPKSAAPSTDAGSASAGAVEKPSVPSSSASQNAAQHTAQHAAKHAEQGDTSRNAVLCADKGRAALLSIYPGLEQSSDPAGHSQASAPLVSDQLEPSSEGGPPKSPYSSGRIRVELTTCDASSAIPSERGVNPCLPAADMWVLAVGELPQPGAARAEAGPAAALECSGTVAAAEGNEGVAAGERSNVAGVGDVSNVAVAEEDSCAISEAVDRLVAEAQRMRLAMDRRTGGTSAAAVEATQEVAHDSPQSDAQAAVTAESAQADELGASGLPTPSQSAGVSAACQTGGLTLTPQSATAARPRLRLFDRLTALAPPLPDYVGVEPGAAVVAALKLAASEDDSISGGLSSIHFCLQGSMGYTFSILSNGGYRVSGLLSNDVLPRSCSPLHMILLSFCIDSALIAKIQRWLQSAFVCILAQLSVTIQCHLS